MTALRHYLFVRHRHNWALLIRFSVVGCTGVVVNLLVFWLLLMTHTDPHGVVAPIVGTAFNVRWYHVFSTCAFMVANVWNFQLNRSWTFQSAGRAPWLAEYGQFLTVGLAGQTLGLLVLTVLLHPHSPVSLALRLLDGSSVARSRELWAQGITIAIMTPVSFVGNKLWTFRAVRRTARKLRCEPTAAVGARLLESAAVAGPGRQWQFVPKGRRTPGKLGRTIARRRGRG